MHAVPVMFLLAMTLQAAHARTVPFVEVGIEGVVNHGGFAELLLLAPGVAHAGGVDGVEVEEEAFVE